MRIRFGSGLWQINLLSLALIAAIALVPTSILRVILGVPFLLFVPGYSLVLALFPRKGELSGMERGALSLGMSIVVVPLAGLMLNYMPWGIRLETVLPGVAVIILAFSAVGWFRLSRLPAEERFSLHVRLQATVLRGDRLSKVLSVALAIAILGSIGLLGYVVAASRSGESFTEFYLLGPGRMAADYPRSLAVGQEAAVTVGIVNREGVRMSYRVEVLAAGGVLNSVGDITLASGEKWEDSVSFVPVTPGDGQRVEFLLFRSEEAEPYLRPLSLWVDVVE